MKLNIKMKISCGYTNTYTISKENCFVHSSAKSYADLIDDWFAYELNDETFEGNDGLDLYNLLIDFANNKFTKNISVDIFDTLYTIEKC